MATLCLSVAAILAACGTESSEGTCTDLFSGGRQGRCCPTDAADGGDAGSPDCTKLPDGWPGYACIPAPASYCVCSCSQQKWQCAC